jgi:hypothetical protein
LGKAVPLRALLTKDFFAKNKNKIWVFEAEEKAV